MLYYTINFNKFYNPSFSEDEVSKNIYNEFKKLSKADKETFIQNNNINIKDITDNIIDNDAIKLFTIKNELLD